MSATNKTETRMARRPRLDIEEMILRLISIFWTILSLLEAQVILNDAYRPIELDRQNLRSTGR
jgi:hypothetical protein